MYCRIGFVLWDVKKKKIAELCFKVSAGVQSPGIPPRLGVHPYHLSLSEAGGKHLSLEKL